MRYLISAAQACATLHKKLWEGLLAYAEQNNAKLIVLPMIGNSAKEDWEPENFPPALRPYLLYDRLTLNSNCAIEQFNVRPYQVDPLTGLNRFAQRGQTLVFASPKQRLRPIAHSNQKYPKFLATTGACTHPNYATSDDVSAERRRLGTIAKHDHTYGAIVVETVDDKLFHLRHIRANTLGKFVDMGTRYNGKTTAPAKCEAMVLGDWHNGQGDPEVYNATYEMIAAFNPKYLVLHDFFDGHSVSHWIPKKPIRELLIQVYDKGLWTLDGELREAGETLKRLSKFAGEVIVVFSNHHVFLHRYLEELRFAHEPHNYRTAVELLAYMAEADYNDPVEAGIKKFTSLPSNITFLREDDDFKVRGFQLGAHGDKSDGGGKFGGGYGGITSKEIAFGKSVSGHVHRAEILRDTYTVGTCLPRNMFYTRGQPSSWTHSHALIWETGTVQLLNIFDGKWGA